MAQRRPWVLAGLSNLDLWPEAHLLKDADDGHLSVERVEVDTRGIPRREQLPVINNNNNNK